MEVCFIHSFHIYGIKYLIRMKYRLIGLYTHLIDVRSIVKRFISDFRGEKYSFFNWKEIFI